MNAPILVFDLDGTLADTASDLVATLNKIMARENAPPVAEADARMMVGAGARRLIQLGFAKAGRSVNEARLEELFRDYLTIYEAHIADHTKLYPGVLAALDRFEAAGWTFAVCTNKSERPALKLMDALGVAERFKAICGQDTFQWCKPDARALTSTIARAGSDVARAIMVGDSRTDVDTAKNAGIPVVAVDFGYTDTHVSLLGPDKVISHFDELWDAVLSMRQA